jgi:hypothetical protein
VHSDLVRRGQVVLGMLGPHGLHPEGRDVLSVI